MGQRVKTMHGIGFSYYECFVKVIELRLLVERKRILSMGIDC